MSETARLPGQERAKHALGRISSFPKNDDGMKKAYRSYVAGLPAMIVMGGLGQGVATCMARAGGQEGQGSDRNEKAYRRLVEDLEDWLCRVCSWSPYYRRRPEGDERAGVQLMARLTAQGQGDYIIAQAEAIAYLDWLKKLANALLDPGKQAGAGDA